MYLGHAQVKIIKDCKALSWLLHPNAPTDKFARMQAYIQRYNYTIEHHAGHQMHHVDSLCREKNNNDSYDWLFTINPDSFLDSAVESNQAVNSSSYNAHNRSTVRSQLYIPNRI